MPDTRLCFIVLPDIITTSVQSITICKSKNNISKKDLRQISAQSS